MKTLSDVKSQLIHPDLLFPVRHIRLFVACTTFPEYPTSRHHHSQSAQQSMAIIRKRTRPLRRVAVGDVRHRHFDSAVSIQLAARLFVSPKFPLVADVSWNGLNIISRNAI
jgi:hypothetical protein